MFKLQDVVVGFKHYAGYLPFSDPHTLRMYLRGLFGKFQEIVLIHFVRMLGKLLKLSVINYRSRH